ncbi:MAG: hypothetical protein R2877_02240 [Bdellovibrionota bacterium]
MRFRKAASSKELKEMYVEINLGDPEMGVAALHYLGLSYQEFSQALFKAPVPPSLSPEEVKMYQVELSNQAMIEQQQAIEGVRKSEERIRAGCVLRVHAQIVRTAFAVQTFGIPYLNGDIIKGVYTAETVSTDKIKVAGKK